MSLSCTAPLERAPDSSGDSYSTTGYDSDGPQPTELNPLGNPEFPGETTADGPNWVGHVIANHSRANTVFFNFAISGSIVQGVKAQYNLRFLGGPGKTPDGTAWTSRDSLFGSKSTSYALTLVSPLGGHK